MLRFFKKKSRSKATQENGNKLLTRKEKAVRKEAHELALLTAEAAKEAGSAVGLQSGQNNETSTQIVDITDGITDKSKSKVQ